MGKSSAKNCHNLQESLANALPSTESYQSSPNHLSQQLNGTTTTQLTTTSPLVVSKKGALEHNCRVAKKRRHSRMRRVKRQEYKKLRQMVPALQEKNKVSKVRYLLL